MRVLIFIGTLRTGGAEAQATRLAEGLAAEGHEVWLRTLIPGGQFWDQLTAAGGDPRSLSPAPARTRLGWLVQLWLASRRLRREIEEKQPDVVLSSLYLSNLVAYRAWARVRSCPLIWSVRCSTIPRTVPRRWYYLDSRRLARRVPMVIYNSFAGMDNHLADGFPEESARVIPNGIDSRRFRPDPAAGRRWRAKVGAGEGPLVGIAARLVEMKGHGTFLRAMERVARRWPEAQFACIGNGSEAYRRRLVDLAAELGIGDRVLWVGEERDMPAAMNGLDLLVSASVAGEAFSNSIGEAMACGRVCVATDLGDAARILGETGVVVPPGDVGALAEAVAAMLGEDPEAHRRRQEAARQRVEDRFSVPRMVKATEELLRQQIEAWKGPGFRVGKARKGRG